MKTFYEQYNHGSRNRYIVRFHDGVKAYQDGSPLFDIQFFTNLPSKRLFISRLRADGYKEQTA